jgi:hypothetical protein
MFGFGRLHIGTCALRGDHLSAWLRAFSEVVGVDVDKDIAVLKLQMMLGDAVKES